jgi:hypothetical protein
MSPLRLLIIVGVVALIILGLEVMTNSMSVSKPVTTSSYNTNSTQTTKFMTPLAFFLRNSGQQYTDNLLVFAKNLKSGDYLFIYGKPSEDLTVLHKVEQAKPMFNSGVNVNSAIFYYKIGDLVDNVPKLPSGVDFIIYDYERGTNYSPEFTTNESTSLGYFDQAKAAITQYNRNSGSNARFMVTPPYGELQAAHWNWGLAVKHMDAVDIQVQAFLQHPDTMKNYVSDVVGQITQESPSTKIFIQLSLVQQRGTIQDNLNAINMLYRLPIDGFLIFYHPSQTSDLEQFFNQIPNR